MKTKKVKCINQPKYLDTDQTIDWFTVGKIYTARKTGAGWIVDLEEGMVVIQNDRNPEKWFPLYFEDVDDFDAYDRAMSIV